ncbi:transcriptional repressor LexA [Patescibacteria group bacterium]|nr:MAG: transcriptional repressor LexA [Patescibacteria group bacterium]
MSPLTKKQREILDYILKVMRERDYTPSYREIAEALDLSSPATVHEHIKRLREKGYLEDTEGAPVMVDKGLLASAKAVVLPLLGLITAGEPIEAVEEKETLAVPSALVKDGENSFVLKVKGRSMIEDGILDGDYVVVEKNPAPRNGEVVVALLENTQATLKRFYRERDRVRLQPANREMQPIYVKNLQVQGVVRAVIRTFATA